MVVVVSGAQMSIGNVRINLCSRNIAVAQQRLHRTRVSPVLQQVSREAVAQRVWRNVMQADLFGVSLDHRPGKLAIQWLAAVQEKIGKG